MFGPELAKNLKGFNTKNKEGYVFRFHPSNFRMKIKFEEYIYLHKIITGVSTKVIWEYLKDKKSFDELLDRVPDEFYKWVKSIKNDLENQYRIIENEYKFIYNRISEYIDVNDKKVFAMHAKMYKYPSILFDMNRGFNYSEFIWKLIKPEFSKPFSNFES